jgi:hypothetical protein
LKIEATYIPDQEYTVGEAQGQVTFEHFRVTGSSICCSDDVINILTVIPSENSSFITFDSINRKVSW